MRHPDNDYPNRDLPNASPSGLFKPGGKIAAEPLSKQQIADIIDSFARAAGSARALGFDAVEVHGAHGYIVDQFLWGALNLREDEYGGDAVERTRFAVELVQAIRAAVGPDFPVILRVSQWKQQDYAARLADQPELLRAILTPIAEAGVDIFHCSQRRYWDAEFDGSSMNLAGWVKQLTGEHAAASADLQPLANRVGAGEFDLVAVGRALLTDPCWAEKVRDGRLDELRAFGQEDLETLS
jgi:2,4-dienoyl-CoA reductase-like NADH-dependent reductase (Old Yellow Enzyme family)